MNLASGSPFVVFAPEYSSVVRYAREHGFAEVITTPDARVLAKGLGNIWRSAKHPDALKENARSALELNHSITKQRAQFLKAVGRLAERRGKGGLCDAIACF